MRYVNHRIENHVHKKMILVVMRRMKDLAATLQEEGMSDWDEVESWILGLSTNAVDELMEVIADYDKYEL